MPMHAKRNDHSYVGCTETGMERKNSGASSVRTDEGQYIKCCVKAIRLTKKLFHEDTQQFTACNVARGASYNMSVASLLASSSARQSKSGLFPCYVGGFILHSSIIPTEVSLPSLLRAVIENVEPEVDGGRFAIKRVVGESVSVEADINADGHQVLDAIICPAQPAARLLLRYAPHWQRPLARLVRYHRVHAVPLHGPGLVGSVQTWIRDLAKKADAGQDIALDFLAGADLASSAATRAEARRANASRIVGPAEETCSCRPRIRARRCSGRRTGAINDALSRPLPRYYLRKGIAGLG